MHPFPALAMRPNPFSGPLLVACLLALSATGCGNKGPLILPPQPTADHNKAPEPSR